VRARPEDIGHPYRGVVEDEVEEEDEEEEEDDDEEVADEVAPVEWTERKVCPDGACIGVIGEDGRCKVCGRVGE